MSSLFFSNRNRLGAPHGGAPFPYTGPPLPAAEVEPYCYAGIVVAVHDLTTGLFPLDANHETLVRQKVELYAQTIREQSVTLVAIGVNQL